MTKKKRCLTCVYFSPHTAAVGSDGDCKFNAPYPTLANPASKFTWPVVGENDWCGQYERDDELDDHGEFVTG